MLKCYYTRVASFLLHGYLHSCAVFYMINILFVGYQLGFALSSATFNTRPSAEKKSKYIPLLTHLLLRFYFLFAHLSSALKILMQRMLLVRNDVYFRNISIALK